MVRHTKGPWAVLAPMVTGRCAAESAEGHSGGVGHARVLVAGPWNGGTAAGTGPYSGTMGGGGGTSPPTPVQGEAKPVRLTTWVGNWYLRAWGEWNNDVYADTPVPGEGNDSWETWNLVDWNGGLLMSGDQVSLATKQEREPWGLTGHKMEDVPLERWPIPEPEPRSRPASARMQLGPSSKSRNRAIARECDSCGRCRGLKIRERVFSGFCRWHRSAHSGG